MTANPDGHFAPARVTADCDRGRGALLLVYHLGIHAAVFRWAPASHTNLRS